MGHAQLFQTSGPRRLGLPEASSSDHVPQGFTRSPWSPWAAPAGGTSLPMGPERCQDRPEEGRPRGQPDWAPRGVAGPSGRPPSRTAWPYIAPSTFLFSLNVFSSQRSDEWPQAPDVRGACRCDDSALMKRPAWRPGRNKSPAAVTRTLNHVLLPFPLLQQDPLPSRRARSRCFPLDVSARRAPPSEGPFP